MNTWIPTADKLVKIGLAVTKLTVGSTRLDAANEIMTVLTNGHDLYADLYGDEKAIAGQLVERAELRIKALANRPDYPAERIETAGILFEQALENCVPSSETLLILALKNDPQDVAEEMLNAAIRASPAAEYARAYSEPGSLDRRFFLDVAGPFLAELRADRKVVEVLAPAIWSDVLTTLSRVETEVKQLRQRMERPAERHHDFMIKMMPIVQYIEERQIDPYELIEAHRERGKVK